MGCRGALLIGLGLHRRRAVRVGRRPDNRVGMLMAATGFAWLVAASGFSDLPLVLHASARSSARVFFAVVLHLLLAFPSGQAAERSPSAASSPTTYVVTTVGVCRCWLFADPAARLQPTAPTTCC